MDSALLPLLTHPRVSLLAAPAEKNTEKRRRQRKEITLQLSKKNLNQLLEEGVRAAAAIGARGLHAPTAKLAPGLLGRCRSPAHSACAICPRPITTAS